MRVDWASGSALSDALLFSEQTSAYSINPLKLTPVLKQKKRSIFSDLPGGSITFTTSDLFMTVKERLLFKSRRRHFSYWLINKGAGMCEGLEQAL